MKRFFCRTVLLMALVAPSLPLPAADTPSPAAILAEREEAEARYKRLAATVEELIAAQDVLQRRLAAQAEEIRRLREELAQAKTGAVSPDSLKQLARQIEDVDKARADGDKRIAEQIGQLGKLIVNAPLPPAPAHGTPVKNHDTPTAPSRENPGAGTANDEGFYHTIALGDRLDTIVQAYRDQGIKVTRAMVTNANPTVNWSRLQPKQKIFIPKPKA